MPCESCGIQFSVFKRKRACSECERYYCSGCLRRGGGTMCAPCRVLSTRPLSRQNIAHLKVRDLQCFLHRQNVSTRGCVEKEELLNLCVSHVNSGAYRRRGPRNNTSAFCTLKGLTTNINEFINSAFDLRSPTSPPPASDRSNCFNSSHLHSPTVDAPHANTSIPDRRFTPTPGGERNIEVPVPEAAAPPGAAPPAEDPPVDSTDCFEIEDLDDTGWEFIARPADPLPNDSSVLLAAASAGTPQRAASSLELRSVSAADDTDTNDTASLQDETVYTEHAEYPTHDQPYSPHIHLSQFKLASDLDTLNVKQLKELLMRNRVEYKGCLERNDLLDRAKMLWKDHDKYKDEIDNLPIEDSCKICMAAPLECVLLECGHIAACTSCARQLAECPICRQYVVRAVRFFRS
ncbi:E3 ubiquitin-protein ligase rififylin [Danaus plexippus plexippus]|uniref:E3 ubiquitin-protein ligase rififylin n=1 Tax=Danaus plexippus plexippus TaxID=278856 RepID=A0A212FEB0_DANPL|nr:E3 ubiquitin-protein ligase rififylin [Danaus plexippus plexippus]